MEPRTSSGVQACRVCGDTEPFHVHNRGRRIDDFFVVGRGQNDFQAAQAWKARALKAEDKSRDEFKRVMEFLNKYGYWLREGSDGDIAYYGGTAQRRLAALYTEEAAK